MEEKEAFEKMKELFFGEITKEKIVYYSALPIEQKFELLQLANEFRFTEAGEKMNKLRKGKL